MHQIRYIHLDQQTDEPSFQGAIASLHAHGLQLHTDAEDARLHGTAIHLAIWATVPIISVMALFWPLARPSISAAWIFGLVAMVPGTWVLWLMWRKVWQFETQPHTTAAILIDRRRQSLVWLQTGSPTVDIDLRTAKASFNADERSAGTPTPTYEDGSLHITNGKEVISLRSSNTRYQQLWLAIKQYATSGDLPLAPEDIASMHRDLRRADSLWQKANPLGPNYGRDWVDHPVLNVWRHVLWPVLAMLRLLQAGCEALSHHLNPTPALPQEATERLGPRLTVRPQPVRHPSKPALWRAVAKGLKYNLLMAPLFMLPLALAALTSAGRSIDMGHAIPVHPFDPNFSIVGAMTVNILWAISCCLVYALLRVKPLSPAGKARKSAPHRAGKPMSPSLRFALLASAIVLPLTVILVCKVLDRVNAQFDRRSTTNVLAPIAAQRDFAVSYPRSKTNTSARTVGYTAVTFALPQADMGETLALEVRLERSKIAPGDAICARRHLGWLGRPWLSQVRICHQGSSPLGP
jgi:hypothetical protein